MLYDGETDLCSAAFDEAAEVADRICDHLIRTWVDCLRALNMARLGDLAEARSALEAQIPALVELCDVHNSGIAYGNVAEFCFLLGDNLGARRALRGNLRLLTQHRNWAVNAEALMTAAMLAARAGRSSDAARLAGAYWRL